MRKAIVLILAMVFMVCLCSCNSKGKVPSAAELSPKHEETGYVVVKADREASDTSLVSTKKNVIYAYTLSDVTFPDQFTAVVISFLDTLPDGTVRETSFPHTKDTLDNFHEKHPYTKVVAGLGGASNSDRLGEVIMDPAKRKVLAESTAKLIKDRGIDGVDLDWEYYNNYSECNAAYLDLAQQLRALLGPSYIISMAGQTSGGFYNEESCIKMMNEVLDYTSVMTYDFDYNYRTNSRIAYNGNFTQLRGVMEGYASVVKDKNKLVIGLPLYGLKWLVDEKRIYYRSEVAKRYEGDFGYGKISIEIGDAEKEYVDDGGVALCFNKRYMYAFDDVNTVTTKTKWACENGFGGMMAWVASSDDGLFSLERAVVTELNKY